MIMLKSTHNEILALAKAESDALRAIVLRLEKENREYIDLLLFKRLPERILTPETTSEARTYDPNAGFPPPDEENAGMDALAAAEIESQRAIDERLDANKPTGSAPVQRG